MRGHLTESELEAYLLGDSAVDRPELFEHLSNCAHCAAIIALDDRLREVFARPRVLDREGLALNVPYHRLIARLQSAPVDESVISGVSPHPSDTTLFDYAHGVQLHDAAALEEHLACCPQCQSVVALQSRLRNAFAPAAAIPQESLGTSLAYQKLQLSLKSSTLTPMPSVGNRSTPRDRRPLRFLLPIAGLLAASISVMVLARRSVSDEGDAGVGVDASAPERPREPSRGPASVAESSPAQPSYAQKQAEPRRESVSREPGATSGRVADFVAVDSGVAELLQRDETKLSAALRAVQRERAKAYRQWLSLQENGGSPVAVAALRTRLDSLSSVRDERWLELRENRESQRAYADEGSGRSSVASTALPAADSAMAFPSISSRGSKAAPGPAGVPERDADAALRREMLRTLLLPIQFDSGSRELPSDSAVLAQLDQRRRTLQRFQGVQIRVIGHADERLGGRENILLGRQRAEKVRGYLEDRGIRRNRIAVQSFGSEKRTLVASQDGALRTLRGVTFEIVAGGDEIRDKPRH